MVTTPTKRTESVTATEITQAAARLFAERGYDATSVRTIAESAGVTCPTLYYHFGNKEGLAYAVLLAPLEAVATSLQELLQRRMDPVERLAEALRCYFEFSRENPYRSRFLYAVMFGPLDRTLAARLDGAIGHNNKLLHKIATILADEGVISAAGVGDLVLALRGQIVIRTMDFLYRGGSLGPNLAIDVVRRILNGHIDGPLGRHLSAPAAPLTTHQTCQERSS